MNNIEYQERLCFSYFAAPDLLKISKHLHVIKKLAALDTDKDREFVTKVLLKNEHFDPKNDN